jgi:uroporphyrinogen decarboxylase
MSKALANDRLIRALLRQPVDRTPVWVMRQAGRYLPEYRELRQQAGSFMGLCTNPDLACEVTMQPLRRFPLDAAILFSDILTIPDAMGLGLYFEAGEGPKFKHRLDSNRAIQQLTVPDMEDELGYVMEAVRRIRKALDGAVPLIGFTGSPWTLATYMVEGGSSKNFARCKELIYNQPDMADQLLATLADSVAQYLNAQIAAGAQALMMFDTWGGQLDPIRYRRFSLEPMRRVLAQLKREHEGKKIPVVLFTKGAGLRLTELAETGADGLGVDWTTDLSQAREWTQDKVALQGNLDPSTLYASPEVIRQEVRRVIDDYGDGPGHVFNLGHGIHPEVNPDHLAVLVDEVHRYSARDAKQA